MWDVLTHMQSAEKSSTGESSDLQDGVFMEAGGLFEGNSKAPTVGVTERQLRFQTGARRGPSGRRSVAAEGLRSARLTLKPAFAIAVEHLRFEHVEKGSLLFSEL